MVKAEAGLVGELNKNKSTQFLLRVFLWLEEGVAAGMCKALVGRGL